MMPHLKILSLAVVSLLSVSSADAIEVIAHRGASHGAPENTLFALRLAWEEGASAAEVDVRLTRDGHVVLMHDEHLKRTAGHPVRVAESTLDELRGFDVGKWKDPSFAGERIPTLEEALQATPPGRTLVVEIKSGKEIVPALTEILRRSGKPAEEIVLISFDYEVLKTLKRELPAHRSYWLLGHEPNIPLAEIFSTYISLAKEAGLDGLNLSARWPLDEVTARRVLDNGLRILVWTIDNPETARRWIRRGATAITTNRPGFMMEALGVEKVPPPLQNPKPWFGRRRRVPYLVPSVGASATAFPGGSQAIVFSVRCNSPSPARNR
jgi:glycerophosphoryl diester phosphodiesterase